MNNDVINMKENVFDYIGQIVKNYKEKLSPVKSQVHKNYDVIHSKAFCDFIEEVEEPFDSVP